MKISLLQPCFRFIFFLFLLTGCNSAKIPFSFTAETTKKPAASTAPAEPIPATQPALSTAEKPVKTVSFLAEKVKPLLALALPETNTKTAPKVHNLVPEKTLKKLSLKKIKDITDGPVEGPVKTFSGIFLGIGMALLLAALVLAIIGTSGAGTLAIIGGSAFLAGAILALISLLTY